MFKGNNHALPEVWNIVQHLKLNALLPTKTASTKQDNLNAGKMRNSSNLPTAMVEG